MSLDRTHFIASSGKSPFTPLLTKSPRRSSHSTEPVTSWKIPQPLTLGSGPGRPLSPSPRGCGVRYEGRIGDYAGEEEGSPGGVSGRRLLCNSGSSGIQLECARGLWVFDGVKPRDQKAALQNYRRFAKHGSMVCIFINDKVIGFASIYWNEDLSKQPPVFVVQLEGEASAINVPTRFKIANNGRWSGSILRSSPTNQS